MTSQLFERGGRDPGLTCSCLFHSPGQLDGIDMHMKTLAGGEVCMVRTVLESDEDLPIVDPVSCCSVCQQFSSDSTVSVHMNFRVDVDFET